MDIVNGGELFYHLQREGKFDEGRSRFYAAELLCALEHLHGFNVVYRCATILMAGVTGVLLTCWRRDLKPENILLDAAGTLKISDFGLSAVYKLKESGKTRLLNERCGSMPYVAPEVL